MRKIICHSLLFSDPHFSIDSKKYEEKWFPPLCNIMPKRMTEKFLHFWDSLTQNAFEKMLKKSKNYGAFDLIIGCGDYTPGVFESGMVTNNAIWQYKAFNELLCRFFENTPRILVWGDHDVGYKFDVSGNIGIKIGTEAGGMSVLSVRRAEKFIGPAFGMLELGMKRIVYISTNLIRNVNNFSDIYLQNLKERQEEFVAERLEIAKENEIIFLLHDPTAININEGIGLLLATHASKVHVLLHGHMHAKWVALMMRLVYNPYRQLCKLFPTYVVPAPWGMMGIGRGFGIMDIFDDGMVKLYWH